MPSSFALLDELISVVRNTQSTGRFPMLKQISVAGFSAGCQIVSRWAFFSQSQDLPGVGVAVILGDCGSYMYLDVRRPAPKCSPVFHDGAHHTCTDFRVPDEEVLAACPNFEEYKYGLNFSSRDWADDHYVAAFRNATTREAAFKAFPGRDVRLLLGEKDACQCRVASYKNPDFCFPGEVANCSFDGCCDTYPDSLSKNLVDDKCEANFEGYNRLQRGLNWAAYMNDFFRRRGVHYSMPLATFDGGHNASAWSRSLTFQQWVGWSSPLEVLMV